MADEQVLTGEVVVRPDLEFTTPERDQDDAPPEEIPFKIDGEVYTIIKPRKKEEVLAQLAEAGARRATTSDALYAGSSFLRRVLAPESIIRLQARLDDDRDSLRIEHVYAIMRKIVDRLSEDDEGAAVGPRPARARTRR